VVDTVAGVGGVTGVDLVGSRADGRANAFSDWDFKVRTTSFTTTHDELPRATLPMRPVVAQWDRLSETWCFMLILAGPVKVDLIFDEAHAELPPWDVQPATLAGIDDHFWDWVLWLRSKQEAGKRKQVRSELDKMHAHLLGPLGVERAPRSLLETIDSYRRARDDWERHLDLSVSRMPEQAVMVVFPVSGGKESGK